VSEERGDGEGSASQSLSLMSDTLRYISLANLDRDTVGLRKINGPVCRVMTEERGEGEGAFWTIFLFIWIPRALDQQSFVYGKCRHS
jgi:hypothetical protein